MKLDMHALMAIRVVRAIVGLIALIFLKATLQPGFEFFFEGEANALPIFLWRFLAGVAALYGFFLVRGAINRAYIVRGLSAPPLRSVWSL